MIISGTVPRYGCYGCNPVHLRNATTKIEKNHVFTGVMSARSSLETGLNHFFNEESRKDRRRRSDKVRKKIHDQSAVQPLTQLEKTPASKWAGVPVRQARKQSGPRMRRTTPSFVREIRSYPRILPFGAPFRPHSFKRGAT